MIITLSHTCLGGLNVQLCCISSWLGLSVLAAAASNLKLIWHYKMWLVTYRKCVRTHEVVYFIRMCAVLCAAVVSFLTSLVSTCCVDLQISGCAGGSGVWSRLWSVRWPVLANALWWHPVGPSRRFYLTGSNLVHAVYMLEEQSSTEETPVLTVGIVSNKPKLYGVPNKC